MIMLQIATLIQEHHHNFCRVYPGQKILPKMHFMAHISRLISKVTNSNDFFIKFMQVWSFSLSLDNKI